MGFPLTFNVLLEGILSRTQLEISAQIEIQKMYPSLPVASSWIEPAPIMHLQKSFLSRIGINSVMVTIYKLTVYAASVNFV